MFSDMSNIVWPFCVSVSRNTCNLSSFNLYRPGGDEGYFTGMMLKKTRVKLLESETVAYPTTQMMRNLLVAQVCAVRTHS